MFNFLFSIPSFFRGMETDLDNGTTLSDYNESNKTEAADAIANRSDWNVIGKDIREVMNSYKVE